jgi:hypothetical protein
MAKRPFPHHVFRARSKQIGIEYEKPPYSKGFKRLIAQNVEAITLFTCRDFIRTMGLPVAALEGRPEPADRRNFCGRRKAAGP